MGEPVRAKVIFKVHHHKPYQMEQGTIPVLTSSYEKYIGLADRIWNCLMGNSLFKISVLFQHYKMHNSVIMISTWKQHSIKICSFLGVQGKTKCTNN